MLLRGSESERRRAVEILVSIVRWCVVVFAAVLVVIDPGGTRWLTAGALALLASTNLVATVVVRRPRSLDTIQVVGVMVVVADLAVVTLAMFDDVGSVERATYLAGILVVFEAAVRWALPGSVLAASTMASAVGAWLAYRADRLGLALDVDALVFRVGMLLLVGLVLGLLVSLLDSARGLVVERLREAEVVSQFALEAPRHTLDDAVWLLAEMLHSDLEFDRVAILFYDEPSGRLHPVANAGFSAAVAELTRSMPPELGFPVAERAGVVSRCFATGRAQIVADVTRDPDYISVDNAVASELAVPLRAGGRRLGALVVSATTKDAFSERDAHLLEIVAGELAQILENARLAEVQRDTIGELERLSRLKDDFIAITSHELRTPLTSLRGFARALEARRRDMTPDQQDEAAQVIARQVERLGGLVEDLLTASLVDSGRHVPTLEEIELAPLAVDVVTDTAATHPDRDVVLDLPNTLPTVRADESFVRRVLVNLVANALRYSRAGTPVTVRAEVANSDVRVAIVDQGPGIPESQIPLLFDRFVRLRSHETETHGTGLGLFIVRGLVESMGGSVSVDSMPGQGSCFAFTVPIAVRSVPEGGKATRSL